MKKTTAITLTLLSAAAFAACDGRRGPERVLAGYRDPIDTTRTSTHPRAGYVPFYRTVYHRRGGSGAYGGSGYRGGTSGGEGGHVGGVSRGGFGGSGGSHGAGS